MLKRVCVWGGRQQLAYQIKASLEGREGARHGVPPFSLEPQRAARYPCWERGLGGLKKAG